MLQRVLFRVLGPLEIEGPAQHAIDFTIRQRRLLSMLLLHSNAWVRPDQLIDAVWPEGPPGLPGEQLDGLIEQVRAMLPPTGTSADRLDGGQDGYRLNLDHSELDVAPFKERIRQGQAALANNDPVTAVAQLESGLALWRGKPFESLETESARAEAERLTELRKAARDALAGARASTASGFAEAYRSLTPDQQRMFRLLSLHPDDEFDLASAAALIGIDADEVQPLLGDLIAVGLLHRNGDRYAFPGPLREHARGTVAMDSTERERQAALARLGEHRGDTVVTPGHGAPVPPAAEATIVFAKPSMPAQPGQPGRPLAHDLLGDLRTSQPTRRGWPAAALVAGSLLLVGGLVALVAFTRVDSLFGSGDAQATPPAGEQPTTTTSQPPTTETESPFAPKRQVPWLAGGETPDRPQLVFGVGDRVDTALDTELVRSAPAGMLTSWYTGPDDLDALLALGDTVSGAYADGYALHLIVASHDEDAEDTVRTERGTGCGRPYPVSERFLSDMHQLAATFAGKADSPPLFVTVYDGIQNYSCVDGAAIADLANATYLQALKDQYARARNVFHLEAPNALVSFGWAGTQTDTDEPKTGGGRSMFQHFRDVLGFSDFTSFFAVEADGNADRAAAMIKSLGEHGPVMLACHQPPPSAAPAFDEDVRAMLTGEYLSDAVGDGLFAMSFCDDATLEASADTYQFVVSAVETYGRLPK